MTTEKPPVPTPIDLRLYKQQEAADIVGVHVNTLRRAVKAGDLPYHQMGGHKRFTLADLAEWQAGMEGRAKPIRGSTCSACGRAA